MSGKHYYNPATGPDKSDKRLSRCKEGVDWTCPGWGTDMSGFAYWNPARKPDMSGFSRELRSKEFFFDDLHFTNSPNASPLIVQS
jgi:hypothetical protein